MCVVVCQCDDVSDRLDSYISAVPALTLLKRACMRRRLPVAALAIKPLRCQNVRQHLRRLHWFVFCENGSIFDGRTFVCKWIILRTSTARPCQLATKDRCPNEKQRCKHDCGAAPLIVQYHPPLFCPSKPLHHQGGATLAERLRRQPAI